MSCTEIRVFYMCCSCALKHFTYLRRGGEVRLVPAVIEQQIHTCRRVLQILLSLKQRHHSHVLLDACSHSVSVKTLHKGKGCRILLGLEPGRVSRVLLGTSSMSMRVTELHINNEGKSINLRHIQRHVSYEQQTHFKHVRTCTCMRLASNCSKHTSSTSTSYMHASTHMNMHHTCFLLQQTHCKNIASAGGHRDNVCAECACAHLHITTSTSISNNIININIK